MALAAGADARFNSRSREGSDPALLLRLLAFSCFNSRSREGSDRLLDGYATHIGSFNSRSREGSDCTGAKPNEILGVSIRAPARGATTVTCWHTPQRAFQFALPRGERRSAQFNRNYTPWFQFALPRGERPSESRCSACGRGFQFALPRGERPLISCARAHYWGFQFALPRGERLGFL